MLAPHVTTPLLRNCDPLKLAQFVAPAAVQVLSTPLHLLGLDVYNRRGCGVSWRERWDAVRSAWVGSCVARIGRIVPAFGVGGVVNAEVRGWGMQALEGSGEG